MLVAVEVAAMRIGMLALVGALALMGCSNGPACDADLVARCPQGSRYVPLCTLNGEEPDWVEGEYDGLANGTQGTCDTDGNLTCRQRSDWSSDQRRQLVLGCHCFATGACDE